MLLQNESCVHVCTKLKVTVFSKLVDQVKSTTNPTLEFQAFISEISYFDKNCETWIRHFEILYCLNSRLPEVFMTSYLRKGELENVNRLSVMDDFLLQCRCVVQVDRCSNDDRSVCPRVSDYVGGIPGPLTTYWNFQYFIKLDLYFIFLWLEIVSLWITIKIASCLNVAHIYGLYADPAKKVRLPYINPSH